MWRVPWARMILFGLTGGIASGKSTVGGFLRARGIPLIDADAVAREVVAPGTEGHALVVAAFGPSIVDREGAIDRKALGAIVFADASARQRLNAIVHPRIGARTLERRGEIEAEGHALACYEAALLVENGLADAFRPLVVVAVSAEIQIARCMARDGLSRSEAMARIASQMPLAEKLALADHVIDNGGTLAETEAQTDAVLARIRRTLHA